MQSILKNCNNFLLRKEDNSSNVTNKLSERKCNYNLHSEYFATCQNIFSNNLVISIFPRQYPIKNYTKKNH